MLETLFWFCIIFVLGYLLFKAILVFYPDDEEG